MFDLRDLAFNFYESDAVKLFKKVRKLAKPSFQVPESIKEEIEKYLKVTEEYCTTELTIGKDRYYRARKHDFDQLKNFSKTNMGSPKPELAGFGRAQMAGISVLYLADSPETAISEVKPDVGELLTVGIFKLASKAKTKIIDLTGLSLPKDPLVIHRKIQNGELWRNMSTLRDLSTNAFSGPVHPRDPRAYYAHALWVQLLQERGYDGVAYRSAVNPEGKCFAFFDEAKFECTQTQLHKVEAVKLTAKRIKLSKLDKQYLAKKKD